MKRIAILLHALITSILISQPAFAGVQGFDASSKNLGVFDAILCSTGLTCTREAGKLKIVSSPTLTGTSLSLSATLGVTGDATLGGKLIVSTSGTPAAADACTAGTIVWGSAFIYVCTATGVWKRAALTGGY